MKCPNCESKNITVVDSRPVECDDRNETRRRRHCVKCNHRFTTYERVAEEIGDTESFDQRLTRLENRVDAVSRVEV